MLKIVYSVWFLPYLHTNRAWWQFSKPHRMQESHQCFCTAFNWLLLLIGVLENFINHFNRTEALDKIENSINILSYIYGGWHHLIHPNNNKLDTSVQHIVCIKLEWKMVKWLQPHNAIKLHNKNSNNKIEKQPRHALT